VIPTEDRVAPAPVEETKSAGKEQDPKPRPTPRSKPATKPPVEPEKPAFKDKEDVKREETLNIDANLERDRGVKSGEGTRTGDDFGRTNTGGTPSTGTTIDSPGGVAKKPTARPPEPTPEPTLPAQAQDRPGADEVIVTDSNRAPAPTVEQLDRQAQSAASRKDCPAVRTIVAQIKKQNESYYKAKIAKNAAIMKCL
jgi:hypothetical protein